MVLKIVSTIFPYLSNMNALKIVKNVFFFFTIVFFSLPDLQWEKLSIWFRDQRDVTWQFEKFIEDYQDYGH